MSTAPAAVNAPAEKAESPVVTPAAAPAEASSLKQDVSIDSRISSLKDPRDVKQLLRELQQPAAPKAPPEEKPAEAAPAAEAPATEKPAEGVETSPAESEPAPEVTPAEQPEEPETEDGSTEADGPVQPATARRLRLQLPPDDKVGRLAAALLQRNRDMPMEEAMAKARDQLGIKTPEAAPAPPPKPKSDLPETIEGVDSALENLETERVRALTALEFENVAKIDSTMRRLDRQRIVLEKDAERQQMEQAASYDRGFASSESQAISLYEFASNPESPGGKRMLEIEADLKANNDPLYASPDKPLKIAQMVASELNIAPKRKGAPAPAQKAAAPAAPAPKKQVLPSGGSTTTPPATNTPPADVLRVNKIKSLKDLIDFRKEIGLPR
jgi:hypothetical protein